MSKSQGTVSTQVWQTPTWDSGSVRGAFVLGKGEGGKAAQRHDRLPREGAKEGRREGKQLGPSGYEQNINNKGCHTNVITSLYPRRFVEESKACIFSSEFRVESAR